MQTLGTNQQQQTHKNDISRTCKRWWTLNERIGKMSNFRITVSVMGMGKWRFTEIMIRREMQRKKSVLDNKLDNWINVLTLPLLVARCSLSHVLVFVFRYRLLFRITEMWNNKCAKNRARHTQSSIWWQMITRKVHVLQSDLMIFTGKKKIGMYYCERVHASTAFAANWIVWEWRWTTEHNPHWNNNWQKYHVSHYQ